MASKYSPEDDLTCPVCLDIYKDPLLLGCSHSSCKSCLEKFWQAKKSKECPVCREESSLDHPHVNLALRNLCQGLTEESGLTSLERETVTFCSLHNEKLKLFCLDDQQPVCLVCRDSKMHSNHRFSPLQEVALDFKKNLKTQLEPLQDKLRTLKDFKLTLGQTIEHIKRQVQLTESQIKEDFEKLRQFLNFEEAARIAALKEEEEQKSQLMKEKIGKISGEISSLSDTIRAIEQQMKVDDLLFIQNYKGIEERTQHTPQDPENPELQSGTLIHVAKHLENLKFRVWEKMLENVQYTPITLDPNTAHPNLILSKDLTSVSFSDGEQQLPQTPERFDYQKWVLGSEVFSEGTHCWDVEVGDSEVWLLGVITESAERKGEIYSRGGVWCVWCCNGKYVVDASSQPALNLTLMEKLKRVRVYLDWDTGILSFSDPIANTTIHTITHTFTEKVLPCLAVGCKNCTVKILPVKPSVSCLS